MRTIKKYKIYINTKSISGYPTRILKFKRTKWLLLKKKIFSIRKKAILRSKLRKKNKKKFRNKKRLKFRKSKKVRIFNSKLIKVSKGHWLNLKLSYKTRVLDKRTSIIFFNNNKAILPTFKAMQNKDIVTFLRRYVKTYFHIDYFLFKHNITPSVFASRHLLRAQKIFLNDEPLKKSIFLKKGDFVHIEDPSYSFRTLNRKYTRVQRWSTFIETDYYLQSLVVVKNLNDFSTNDFSLAVGSYIDFNTYS